MEPHHDVDKRHAATAREREHEDPHEGRNPIPLLMLVFAFGLAALGGVVHRHRAHRPARVPGGPPHHRRSDSQGRRRGWREHLSGALRGMPPGHGDGGARRLPAAGRLRVGQR